MQYGVFLLKGTDMEQNKRGISSFVLKMIAITAMLIDHIGGVVLETHIDQLAPGVMMTGGPEEIQTLAMAHPALMLTYLIFRLIGRFGFPLFAFMIAEGFTHTRSVKKYALNLGIFALISELPFNLASRRRLFCPSYQNVFFTLLLGLLCIWAIHEFAESKRFGEEKWKQVLITILAVVVCAGAAELLGTDYGMWGVSAIAILYILRKRRKTAFALACLILTIMNSMEITAFLMLIPIALYNGERGPKLNKYIFYAFYPVHLAILYLIALSLGFVTFTVR